jgi:NADH-quinone oxidoreductase subunit N
VAGVESALWTLILLLVFGSAIGLFYELRLVVAMYGSPPEAADVQVMRPAPSLSFATILILTMFTLGVVWMGPYPAPLIHTILLTVASLL